MTNRVCVVTGATGGIGAAIAVGLARQGGTVVVGARNQERGERAAERVRAAVPGAGIEVATGDLSDPESVRQMAAGIRDRHGTIDVLVHNAGVITFRRQETPTGLELTFATNHLGPFLLTDLLRPTLGRTSRVITVASSTHRQVKHIDWDDLPYGRRATGLSRYGVTKMLNVLFTYELARRFDGAAACVDPGFVHSGLGRGTPAYFRAGLVLARPFQRTPEQGADTAVYLAGAAEMANGGFYVKRRQVQSSPLSYDREAAARLWALSEELVSSRPGPG
jgi:NAD(P)-dependent dehydrogenase (short-subunit alcohol dehydrogenase family)